MTEMKAACPIYPEIDILPHGIEYHRYGQYRLLMCTDPALLAQYDRTTYMNKGFEDYLGASYLNLYNDLLSDSLFEKHAAAVSWIMEARVRKLISDMKRRDGLDTPNLARAEYEQIFWERNHERIELPWLLESYREQAEELVQEEIGKFGRPFVEMDFDKMKQKHKLGSD